MNSNIPIPKWEMPREADLLLQMNIGDSVATKGLSIPKFYEVAKALGMVITCRASEAGEYRVWRVV